MSTELITNIENTKKTMHAEAKDNNKQRKNIWILMSEKFKGFIFSRIMIFEEVYKVLNRPKTLHQLEKIIKKNQNYKGKKHEIGKWQEKS